MPGPDDGNAAKGAKLFKAKCATCHTANEGGPNKQGPNLFGVIGRKSGQVAGFKYTKANTESGIEWSNQTMFDYLKDEEVHQGHEQGLPGRQEGAGPRRRRRRPQHDEVRTISRGESR